MRIRLLIGITVATSVLLLVGSTPTRTEAAASTQAGSALRPKVKQTFLNDAACTLTGRLFGEGLRAKGKRLRVKKKKNLRLKGPGTVYTWSMTGSCCIDGEGEFVAPTRRNKNAAVAFSCPTAAIETPFGLASKKFADGGTIPDLYTCDGSNISPPLEIRNVPAGTQSFVLIVDDPDAPGSTFVHWVLYDIPATHAIFRPNFQPGKYGVSGTNDAAQLGYFGACSPPGDDPHHYSFRLYALDIATLGLAEGATKAQVEAAMDGHVLEMTELTGLFARG